MDTRTGRLTADARVNQVNGKSVVNFSIAVDKTYTKDGQKHPKTQFIDCGLWNRPNIAPHLKKGELIQLWGELEARAYTKDNQAVAVLSMHVNTLDFLTPRRKATEGVAEAITAEQVADDLPF